MAEIDELAKDLELEKLKRKADLGPVRPPEMQVHDLHGIPFAIGERVFDKERGGEGEVIGAGIKNL